MHASCCELRCCPSSDDDRKYFMLTDDDGLIPVPAEGISYTAGLSHFLRKAVSHQVFFPTSKLCRLFQDNRCTYEEDCRHLHVCRTVYSDLIVKKQLSAEGKDGKRSHSSSNVSMSASFVSDMSFTSISASSTATSVSLCALASTPSTLSSDAISESFPLEVDSATMLPERLEPTLSDLMDAISAGQAQAAIVRLGIALCMNVTESDSFDAVASVFGAQYNEDKIGFCSQLVAEILHQISREVPLSSLVSVVVLFGKFYAAGSIPNSCLQKVLHALYGLFRGNYDTIASSLELPNWDNIRPDTAAFLLCRLFATVGPVLAVEDTHGCLLWVDRMQNIVDGLRSANCDHYVLAHSAVKLATEIRHLASRGWSPKMSTMWSDTFFDPPSLCDHDAIYAACHGKYSCFLPLTPPSLVSPFSGF